MIGPDDIDIEFIKPDSKENLKEHIVTKVIKRIPNTLRNPEFHSMLLATKDFKNQKERDMRLYVRELKDEIYRIKKETIDTLDEYLNSNEKPILEKIKNIIFTDLTLLENIYIIKYKEEEFDIKIKYTLEHDKKNGTNIYYILPHIYINDIHIYVDNQYYNDLLDEKDEKQLQLFLKLSIRNSQEKNESLSYLQFIYEHKTLIKALMDMNVFLTNKCIIVINKNKYINQNKEKNIYYKILISNNFKDSYYTIINQIKDHTFLRFDLLQKEIHKDNKDQIFDYKYESTTDEHLQLTFKHIFHTHLKSRIIKLILNNKTYNVNILYVIDSTLENIKSYIKDIHHTHTVNGFYKIDDDTNIETIDKYKSVILYTPMHPPRKDFYNIAFIENATTGGKQLYKKTDEKQKLMGRERCIYKLKNKKYIKVKGEYISVSSLK